MTFDLERAQCEGCRTRDGRPVRILATDLATSRQEDDLVIAIMEAGGNEVVYCCAQDGGNFDLVNLPESHEVTVQLFKNEFGHLGAQVWLAGELIGFLPPKLTSCESQMLIGEETVGIGKNQLTERE